MNHSPEVTCIIPNYNNGKYLAKCIESCLPHKVILVDDCSIDNSVEIAKRYPVTVVERTETSGGCVVPINQALDMVDTDYLSVISSDDFWWPLALDNLVATAERGYDWVYPNLYLTDEGGCVIGLWDYTGWPTDWQEGLRRCKELNSVGVPFTGVKRVSWLRENGLRWHYAPHAQYSEDAYTCPIHLMAKPRIAHDPSAFMCYRSNPTSFMHTRQHLDGAVKADVAELLRGIA